jgi:hypothetical protein
VLTSRIILGHFICRYGYEALAIWAALGAVIACLRIAVDNLDWIEPETARMYATIAYVAAFVILVEITRAEWRWHKIIGRGHGKRGRT